MRLGNEFIGFSLFGLKLGADVFTHINVGDVYGEDLERRVGIERFVQDGLGDTVRILEYIFVALRGADGGDDAFADARNDGFLRRAADETFEVRPHGHAGLGFDDNAVLGHRVDGRLAGGRVGTIDHFRVHRCAHRFNDRLAGAFGGEVDRAGTIEVEANAGLLRGDERLHHHFNVAARQIMSGQVVDRDIETRFHGGNARVHDHPDGKGAQAQGDQLGVGDASAGEQGANPDAEEVDENDENDQSENAHDPVADNFHSAREFAELRLDEVHSFLGFGIYEIALTTTRMPSTATTLIGVPRSIMGPSVTTSTRLPLMKAVPEGRKLVSAVPA